MWTASEENEFAAGTLMELVLQFVDITFLLCTAKNITKAWRKAAKSLVTNSALNYYTSQVYNNTQANEDFDLGQKCTHMLYPTNWSTVLAVSNLFSEGLDSFRINCCGTSSPGRYKFYECLAKLNPNMKSLAVGVLKTKVFHRVAAFKQLRELDLGGCSYDTIQLILGVMPHLQRLSAHSCFDYPQSGDILWITSFNVRGVNTTAIKADLDTLVSLARGSLDEEPLVKPSCSNKRKREEDNQNNMPLPPETKLGFSALGVEFYDQLETLLEVCRSCPELLELEINAICTPDLDNPTVGPIFQHLPKLEKFACNCCLNFEDIIAIRDHCPNIRCLQVLEEPNEADGLKHALHQLLSSCTHLEELDIGCAPGGISVSTPLPHLPLRKLRMRPHYSFDILPAIIPSVCHSLQELDLTECSSLGAEVFVDLFSACKRLLYVTVPNSTLDNQGFVALAHCCLNIRELDISRTQVTSSAVYQALDKPGVLQSLYSLTWRCRTNYMSDREALYWSKCRQLRTLLIPTCMDYKDDGTEENSPLSDWGLDQISKNLTFLTELVLPQGSLATRISGDAIERLFFRCVDLYQFELVMPYLLGPHRDAAMVKMYHRFLASSITKEYDVFK